MNRYLIYTLRDEDGCVRYVGCTSHSAMGRLKAHKNAKSPVGEWIRRELEENRKVTICHEEAFEFHHGTYIIEQIGDEFFVFRFELKQAARLRVYLWIMAMDDTIPAFDVSDARRLSNIIHEIQSNPGQFQNSLTEMD